MTFLIFTHSASRMLLDVNLYTNLSDSIKDNIPLDWTDTKLNYACFGAQSALVIMYAIIVSRQCWLKRWNTRNAKTDEPA